MKLLLYRDSEILPNSRFYKVFLNIVCRSFPNLLCENLLFLISGVSDHQMNLTRLPVYVNHLPASSSISNFIHFGQNVKTKRFQMLDYMDDEQNMECYNSILPPQIPVERIRMNDLFLFHSLNDRLADPKDVEHLKKNLKGKLILDAEFRDFKINSHFTIIILKQFDFFIK